MEWYRLKCCGLKDSKIKKAMDLVETYDEFINFSDEKLKAEKFTEEEIKIIKTSIDDKNYLEEIEKLKKQDIKLISLKDKKYPELLKNIASPPLFLYYKGNIDILTDKTFAIVGTRRSTKYGRAFIENIIYDFVENGITIVSGFAQGIDITVHREVLKYGGNTVVVLPCGLDKIYPWEHRREWKIICERGVILTEFPLGTEPYKYNFPLRNRIIGGLARGVLVVESGEKGGSLITANLAFEENRDIFALPGDITYPNSVGCNNLIKDNKAKLVKDASDILVEYDWNEKEIRKLDSNLNTEENIVYQQLTTAMTVDELNLYTKIGCGKILSILTSLELKNLVMAVSGGRYKRKV